VTVEIATGRYSTFDASMGVPVAITVGRPKFPLRYEIEHEMRRLAPWGLLKLDGDEFVQAYRSRLERLDLAAFVAKFEAISARHGGRRVVLLCYENVHAGQLCHRRVFAEWFEERTAQAVPEVEILATTTRGLSGQLQLDVEQSTAPTTGAEGA
jgi:hypothetical protein